MADSPQSLQSLFASGKAQRKALESAIGTSSTEYQENLQAAIATFEACQRLVGQASLFSRNETVDDIASGDLEYLLVDYFLAELVLRKTIPSRLEVLEGAHQLYESFLERLDTYDILTSKDRKLYERFLEDRKGFLLASPTDAAARRQVKVTRYQDEKTMKQKLEHLAQDPTALQNDDAALRELRLTELGFHTHQTFQSLDLMSQEFKMLANAPSLPPLPEPANDRREYERSKDKYSDKLDPSIAQLLKGGRSGPLLSKSGRPLQPFTLTDRRTQLQAGVFKPGHNLPTMSIDEYLEEEKRRGGIIEGGGEQSGQAPEIDEDDLIKADEETMKAREWDEFKEANPKGAGNTLNRG